MLPAIAYINVTKIKAHTLVQAVQPVQTRVALETVRRLCQPINEVIQNIGLINAARAAGMNLSQMQAGFPEAELQRHTSTRWEENNQEDLDVLTASTTIMDTQLTILPTHPGVVSRPSYAKRLPISHVSTWRPSSLYTSIRHNVISVSSVMIPISYSPSIRKSQHLIESLEKLSPGFQHVTLMQGGKAYGCHIGPFPSPAKESDPRHMPRGVEAPC